jgi:uncharacterized protein YqjF (DUF2071 family)
MEEIFHETAHRPWPIADRPWSVAMCWHDLLFAHWPVAPQALRPLIPSALEIDTFDGTAWIGIVPFRMTCVRLRRAPSLCSLAFPELNVRTYVRAANKPGVWFLSLDAAHRLAVRIARAWYGLPYLDANIQVRHDGTAIDYESRRRGTKQGAARLRVRYQPSGDIFHAQPGTLEHWLIERYCLYAARTNLQVGYGDVHHCRWPLQQAEAEFETNTMFEPLGLARPDRPPILHFARRLDVVAWSVTQR